MLKHRILPGICPGFLFALRVLGSEAEHVAERGVGFAEARLGRSFFEYSRCSLGEDDRHKELGREKVVLT